jgi:hypothetical protein
VTGPDGVATAKLYSATSWANWLLWGSVTHRDVVELQVPKHVLSRPVRPRGARHVDWGKLAAGGDDWVAYLKLLLARRIAARLVSAGDPGEELAFLMNALMVRSTDGQVGLFEIRKYADLLKDSAQDGFDRTFADDEGGTIRVQNLGGGVIRVESRAYRTRDVFGMLQ